MKNGSSYDFIVIGSGAGGGTLAYRLAPSGKKILLIERDPFVRREKENWNSLEVNARAVTIQRNAGAMLMAQSCIRTRTITSAEIRSSTAPRSSVCARKILARSNTTAASRRPGRFATMSWSRITPRPSGSITCTGQSVKIQSSRAGAAPILTQRSDTNRASSS